MPTRHPFVESCEFLLREQLPNLFRLYLNPYVAQTCLCLERYVQTTWGKGTQQYQTFLANSFDEALSGAIKLARYTAALANRPATGLIVDPTDRLGPFVSAKAGGTRVEFLPGLTVAGRDASLPAGGDFGFVVLLTTPDGAVGLHTEAVRTLIMRDAPLLIVGVDRTSLAALRRTTATGTPAPDIVVFDESFVNRDVPFGAFTARQALYGPWNKPGKTTFHSTTFQPNTIASLHFMRCLEIADPAFHAALAEELTRLVSDLKHRAAVFRRTYSPSLVKAIRMTNFETADVRAAGDFIHADGRKIFDAVSGVACSVRGHNPPTYVEEIEALPDANATYAELENRLRDLSGLGHIVPAVSGASAIENALKIALVARSPRRYVVALKAGFGGKTLFALTGTWNASYKEHLEPLYAEVVYVDPFAPDALAQIDAALAAHEVAVVQIELIQAVGGVRLVPEAVVRHLAAGRERHGYLLLVDEVQTGMYRTGPFVLSRAMGLEPDLLVTGKGTSDMMFPCAMLLVSDAVQAALDRVGSDLPAQLRRRYGYDFGYRTVLNVLRRCEKLALAERVAESVALVGELLTKGLADCPAVREVRTYGLLIGIELNAARWPQRWVRKRLFWFYLYAMLHHVRYPVLVGFCQYEPNVLKITPALTAAPDELRQMCATVVEVLRRPFYRLLARVLGGLLRSVGIWRRKTHERRSHPAPEPGPH
jgi:acetylornithine/succinyldiaminopimelate/putrescine aminotransferase